MSSENFDIDKDFDSNTFFAWYTLKSLFLSEEKVVGVLKERINLHNLNEDILDIQYFVEYKIEESNEYDPNSDELPVKGFKNTEKLIWVKTIKGKYKKVKIVEKKPFKSTLFLKMIYSPELFKRIKGWDQSIYFLGDPNPQAMSDFAFERMKKSISSEKPDLNEYIKEKNYVIVSGSRKEADSVDLPIVEENEVLVESKSESIILDEEVVEDVEKFEVVKEKNVKSEAEFVNKNKLIDPKKLAVNDYVFVNDLGVQGQVQHIDLKEQVVVVSLKVFGRNQPVTCKFDQLSQI